MSRLRCRLCRSGAFAVDTAQAGTFSRTSVSGVQTPTRALSTVTALDHMRVNRTLTSHGETSVGEIELYPVAIRATGDKELNAKSRSCSVAGRAAKVPRYDLGEVGDKSGTNMEELCAEGEARSRREQKGREEACWTR